METKKSPKASLENKRGLFFKIGLSITLFLVFCAFEWTFPPSKNILTDPSFNNLDEDFIDRTYRDEKPKPPPVRPPITQFIITDNPFANDTTSDIFNNDTTSVTPPYKDIDIDSTDVEEVLPPYKVEKLPEFIGGHEAMLVWIRDHIKYPDDAKSIGTSGTVFISFIVNKDGSISDVDIPKKLDYSLDKEGMRIVSMMPNWKPGIQNGKPVKVSMVLPIKFKLEN